MKKLLLVGAAAATIFAAGCTDLKPIQAQIDDLKSQVAKNAADTASLKAGVDAAMKAAQAAQSAAAQAQTRADAAMALAQDDKARIDALSAEMTEKMTKGFKKGHEK